jgi:hypothetical protein
VPRLWAKLAQFQQISNIQLSVSILLLTRVFFKFFVFFVCRTLVRCYCMFSYNHTCHWNLQTGYQSSIFIFYLTNLRNLDFSKFIKTAQK